MLAAISWSAFGELEGDAIEVEIRQQLTWPLKEQAAEAGTGCLIDEDDPGNPSAPVPQEAVARPSG